MGWNNETEEALRSWLGPSTSYKEHPLESSIKIRGPTFELEAYVVFTGPLGYKGLDSGKMKSKSRVQAAIVL